MSITLLELFEITRDSKITRSYRVVHLSPQRLCYEFYNFRLYSKIFQSFIKSIFEDSIKSFYLDDRLDVNNNVMLQVVLNEPTGEEISNLMDWLDILDFTQEEGAQVKIVIQKRKTRAILKKEKIDNVSEVIENTTEVIESPDYYDKPIGPETEEESKKSKVIELTEDEKLFINRKRLVDQRLNDKKIVKKITKNSTV